MLFLAQSAIESYNSSLFLAKMNKLNPSIDKGGECYYFSWAHRDCLTSITRSHNLIIIRKQFCQHWPGDHASILFCRTAVNTNIAILSLINKMQVRYRCPLTQIFAILILYLLLFSQACSRIFPSFALTCCYKGEIDKIFCARDYINSLISQNKPSALAIHWCSEPTSTTIAYPWTDILLWGFMIAIDCISAFMLWNDGLPYA